MFSRLQARAHGRKSSDEAMSQGVVPLIILIAGFVVITMLVISFIHRSVQNKTVDAGNCVEGSNTYGSVNEEKHAQAPLPMRATILSRKNRAT